MKAKFATTATENPRSVDREVQLNIHGLLRCSRANGPGLRLVIWFQGCTLNCPQCFNPQTHAAQAGETIGLTSLLETIMDRSPGIEGVTITGGEPFQQPFALLRLVQALREVPDFSTVVFSGFTLDEITRLPLGSRILCDIDVLIAGRYVHTQRLARGLRGSVNQIIHLLTPRYSEDELRITPCSEIQVNPSGNIVLTGISPFPESMFVSPTTQFGNVE